MTSLTTTGMSDVVVEATQLLKAHSDLDVDGFVKDVVAKTGLSVQDAVSIAGLVYKASNFMIASLGESNELIMTSVRRVGSMPQLNPHIVEHLIELAKRYQEIHMHAVQHVRQIKVLCVTAQEYFPEFPDLLEEHDGETYQECMNDIKVSFEKAHKYFITYVEHVQEVCNELNEVEKDIDVEQDNINVKMQQLEVDKKGEREDAEEDLKKAKKKTSWRFSKAGMKQMLIGGVSMALAVPTGGASLAVGALATGANVIDTVDKFDQANSLKRNSQAHKDTANEMEKQIVQARQVVAELVKLHDQVEKIAKKLQNEKKAMNEISKHLTSSIAAGEECMKRLSKYENRKKSMFMSRAKTALLESVTEFKNLEEQCEQYLINYGDQFNWDLSIMRR